MVCCLIVWKFNGRVKITSSVNIFYIDKQIIWNDGGSGGGGCVYLINGKVAEKQNAPLL